MKSLILILTIELFISTFTHGQKSLFQEGATWIATHESDCGIGYEIFKYIGDTTYKENTIRIIEQNIITYSYKLADYYTGMKSQQYFMQRGNKLYKVIHNFIYIDSLDHGPRLIFDYDAQVGDTIIHNLKRHSITNKLQYINYTTIDSIKNEKLGREYFKTWYGKYYSSSTILENTAVVYNERIGEQTHFPLLPRGLRMKFEFPEFIYYTDNTGFEFDPYDEYKNFIEMQKHIDSKEQPVKSTQYAPALEHLKLSPNPADNFIEAELPDHYDANQLSYEIHKMDCGTKTLSGIFDNSNIRIDISGLESGVYLLLVKESRNFRFVERFVKM